MNPITRTSVTWPRRFEPALRPTPVALVASLLLAGVGLTPKAVHAQTVTINGGATQTVPPNLSATTLNVGQTTNGTLNVTSGGTVTSTNSYVGSGTAAVGTVSVSGVGALWTNSAATYIGYTGTGNLTVNNGATLYSGGLLIGSQTGGHGAATIDGAGTIVSTSQDPTASQSAVIVGLRGAGALTLSGGATLNNALGYIGDAVGSSATVTVTGAGTTWNIVDFFGVGGDGPTTLNITHGAVINSSTDGTGNNWVGSDPTAPTSVDISGTGSTWNAGGSLLQGNASSVVTIENGGTLAVPTPPPPCDGSTCGGIAVGYDLNRSLPNGTGQPATATLTVTGAGSQLLAGKFLYVGDSLNGALNVLNGGVATSDTAVIGLNRFGNPQTVGTALVSGTGSAWNVGEQGLYVGVLPNSTGTLTVANGGSVTVAAGAPSSEIAEQAGSVGSIVIGGAPGQPAVAPGSVAAPAGLAFGAGTGSLVFNHTDTSGNYVFSPPVGCLAGLPGSCGQASVSVLAGVTALTGDSTYTTATGTSIAAGAELRLGNGGTTGSIVDNVVDNGTLSFDRSDTLTYAGAISGPGAVNQIGSGITVLTSANGYSGATGVAAGTLRAGAANTFSPNSAVTTGAAGTLDLAGFDQTLAALTNSGTVNMGTGTAPGTTLTVAGNYVGNGGTIAFNTALAADDSPTDQMVVNGSATGSTSVDVTNAGGAGASTTGNGIELIRVLGDPPVNTFTLGRPVEAGAYQYLLYRGGVGADAANSNWYLRTHFEAPPVEPPPAPPPAPQPPGTPPSSPPVPPVPPVPPAPPSEPGVVPPPAPEPGPIAWRPGVVAYTMAPLLNLDYGFSMVSTLHQRMGDVPGAIDPQQGTADNGVWARMNVRSFDADALGRFSTDSTTYFAQFGKDWTLAQPGDGGSTHVGATATLGNTTANFDDRFRAIADLPTGTGTVATQTGSVGGYWTRYLKDGTYFDSVGQLTYYHNRYGGADGSPSQSGVGVVLSQEVGKPFQIGSTPVAIEPRAQLMYQYLSLGNYGDTVSAISGTHTNALRGRMGFRLFDVNGFGGGGGFIPLISVKPYLTFDVERDFVKPGQTVVGGTAFNPTFGRTWYDVGAGVTAVAGKHGELYAHGGYQSNLGGSDSRGYYGQVAYRYRW